MLQQVMGLAVLFTLLAILARLLQLGFAVALVWLAAVAAVGVLLLLVIHRLRRAAAPGRHR